MKKVHLLSILFLFFCGQLLANSFNDQKILTGAYKVMTKKVLVKPAVIKRIYTPPVFETTTEQRLVTPRTMKWVKGRRNRMCCFSSNPEDCRVWVLKEIKPVYETITIQQIIKLAAFKDTLLSPAIYKTMQVAVPIAKSRVVVKEEQTGLYKLAIAPIQTVEAISKAKLPQKPMITLAKVKPRKVSVKKKAIKQKVAKKTVNPTNRVHTYTNFALKNSPNPFREATTISYTLPENDFVTVRVYNLLGKLVRTLVNEPQTMGKHEVVFEKENLPGGMYFYTLQAGKKQKSQAMVIVD